MNKNTGYDPRHGETRMETTRLVITSKRGYSRGYSMITNTCYDPRHGDDEARYHVRVSFQRLHLASSASVDDVQIHIRRTEKDVALPHHRIHCHALTRIRTENELLGQEVPQEDFAAQSPECLLVVNSSLDRFLSKFIFS